MQGIGGRFAEAACRGSGRAIGFKYRQGRRIGDARSLRGGQDVGDDGLACTGRAINLPGTVEEGVVLDDGCAEGHATLVLNELWNGAACGREVTASVSQATVLEVVIR